MAILHYDVTFSAEPPSLVAIKRRIEERTGLAVHVIKDALDADTVHHWPHIGRVRESASFECDEADGIDFELTIGSAGVRLTCVAPGLNHYLRDQTLATLKDLGGAWTQALSPTVNRKWSELSDVEKHA